MAYYYELRLLYFENSHLKKNLTRCARCGIYFLTDPRNRNRTDISCPFGCRSFHKKEQSNHRSREYYRDEEGKIKKKALNRKRKRKKNADKEANEDFSDFEKCSPILNYICQIYWLIYRHRYSKEYIYQTIQARLRQHSLDKWGWSEYFYARTAKQPP